MFSLHLCIQEVATIIFILPMAKNNKQTNIKTNILLFKAFLHHIIFILHWAHVCMYECVCMWWSISLHYGKRKSQWCMQYTFAVKQQILKHKPETTNNYINKSYSCRNTFIHTRSICLVIINRKGKKNSTKQEQN